VHESQHFALLVVVVAGAGLLAVLSSRVSELVRLPGPVIFLVAAAVTVRVVGPVHAPPLSVVEDLVTVALVVILFDGGAQLGWRRARSAAPTIVAVGVLGTFLTAAAVAALLHVAFGLDWYPAFLVGTAVAPTDPAVVFSVLGGREIQGDSGAVLEGESGANDPVGIALMAGLLSAHRLSAGAVGHVALEFAQQMAVGAAIGLAASWLLLQTARRVGLSSDSLYALLVLSSIQLVYGVATVAHGSGFLAVFVVGIALGDADGPYKREVVSFHSALASLGEIVAFVVLGLTVDVARIFHTDVWIPGLVLGLLLAVVIRPVCAGLCLLGSPLDRRERAFVLAVGLKGAVPILLGTLLLASGVAQASRLYAIVVVVVVISVVGQGSLVPLLARRLRLPMLDREPGSQPEVEPGAQPGM
jgi:cell volume regulation protein A